MPSKIGAAWDDDNIIRMSSAPAGYIRHRDVHQLTTRQCVDKAHMKGTEELKKEKVDTNVEIFIKAKLGEWDKDRSGRFTMEETEAAMEELKQTQRDLANLKWLIIMMFVGIFLLVLLVLCAAGVAVAITKQTGVSNDGAFVAKQSGKSRLVVTSSSRDELTLGSTLGFNAVTDDWKISDANLRELDTITFETDNGTFYSMPVTELARFDSGPTGNADTLDIMVVGNHYIRFWENIGTLEIQWANTTMWETLQTGSRRLDADEDDEDDDGSDADRIAEVELNLMQMVPVRDSSPKPPNRLLSKGGFGGAFGRGRAGGASRVAPGYSGVSDGGFGSTYGGFGMNTRSSGRGYYNGAKVCNPSIVFGPVLAVCVLLAVS